VSCLQCYPCLSFCVLCPMLRVSIFLCLVSNVTPVWQHWTQDTQRQIRATLDTRHRRIDTGNMGHKTQKDRHVFLCLVSNVTRVYLSVSCAQCYPCLSFCVLCPMLPLSVFLCLVSNVIDTCHIGHKTQKDRHG
jgi:hypothetical protein